MLVFADAGIEPVVPEMHAANQVVAFDESVGHQRTAVRAATVHDRHIIVHSHDDEIDGADQRMLRRTIFKFFPISNDSFFHSLVTRS